MAYNPIEDEFKKFSLREFEVELKAAIVEYADIFDGANDFTKESHTFAEWMRTFGRFMSGGL